MGEQTNVGPQTIEQVDMIAKCIRDFKIYSTTTSMKYNNFCCVETQIPRNLISSNNFILFDSIL